MIADMPQATERPITARSCRPLEIRETQTMCDPRLLAKTSLRAI